MNTTTPSAVRDPRDGTVLGHLDHDGVRVLPEPGVTVEAHQVDGVTIDVLTRDNRQHYVVMRSSTPTTPLTRAQLAQIGHTVIDLLTTPTTP